MARTPSSPTTGASLMEEIADEGMRADDVAGVRTALPEQALPLAILDQRASGVLVDLSRTGPSTRSTVSSSDVRMRNC